MFSPDSVLSAVVLDIVDMIAGVHPAASVHSTLVFLVVKEVLVGVIGIGITVLQMVQNRGVP